MILFDLSIFFSLFNHFRTAMAMDEYPEKDINENDRILDLHKGTTRRSSNEKTAPEDARGSEHDSSLLSPSQRRSPDGFPGLLGSDRKRGLRSNLASEFWSQGVANWRALDNCSNGNEKISDLTALIKEPGNPPTGKDTTESTRTYSRDQIHRSRILSFLESDGTSAPSSVEDHAVRPVPDAAVTGFDEVHEHKKEPLRPSLGNAVEFVAPEVGARDQSLELKAQQGCSTISETVSDSSTKPRGGKKHDSLMGADAMSLHAGRAGNTTTSHLEIEDDLLGLPTTAKTNPAIPTGSTLSFRAYSGLGGGLQLFFHKQRQNPYTPPKAIQLPKNNESSSAKTASHLSEPRSVTPVTPTRNPKIRHPKSLSAEAPAFHPSPPSNSPATPTRSHSNGHGRSVSIGNGHSNPRYVSVMPNTPLGQRSLRPSKQSSIGMSSAPVGSRVFKNFEEVSQPSIDYHYPEPHQHTPEGQGQCFDTHGSMPTQMPPQSCDSLGPNMPTFSFPMHSFHNERIHYNAQFYEQGEHNAEYSHSNHFDTYATSQAPNTTPNAGDLQQNGNVYTQETNGYAPRYYSNHADPSHQVHSCAHREDYAVLINS